MEDFDILNKFDNDKLIDIVKNYKRYGYNDALRNYVINLLEELLTERRATNVNRALPSTSNAHITFMSWMPPAITP